MICYLDSSILLRALFNQQGAFEGWGEITQASSSELLSIECHRVIDRFRLIGEIDDKQVAEIKNNLQAFLKGVTLFSIDRKILNRAKESFPTIIGTLNAIHLSTLLLWQEQLSEPITLLTHDEQLLTASCAYGFSTRQ